MKQKFLSIAIIFTSVLFVTYLAFQKRANLDHDEKSINPIAAKQSENEKSALPAKSRGLQVPEVVKKRFVIEEAIETTKSIEEFYHEYAGYEPLQLEHVILSSKQIIEKNNLIEKSNAGSLSEKEVLILATELHRQTALRQLIAEDEIQQLKKKFL